MLVNNDFPCISTVLSLGEQSEQCIEGNMRESGFRFKLLLEGRVICMCCELS